MALRAAESRHVYGFGSDCNIIDQRQKEIERIWVNDEETPLIDAGVASGNVSEHKAMLRLIGGRSYPLRMEYFKATKDKNVAVALLWKPPHGVEQVIPARNLSPGRVTPTLVINTPFPPDDSSVGYERGVSISKAWDEAATQAAIEVANQVVKHLDRLSGSKAGDTNRAAHVEAFCDRFVAAALPRAREAANRVNTTHPARPAGLSQCETILGALLVDGGWLSALELHNLSGSLAVHSRIADLRKRGQGRREPA